MCGPGSREECYTPPLRAPRGSPGAAGGRGELSRRRLQEGVGEAGKQAEGRLELNNGEGARGRAESACLVPGVRRAECQSPTEEGEDGARALGCSAYT